MAREGKVLASNLLIVVGLFFLMSCGAAEEPDAVGATGISASSGTVAPTAANGSQQGAEEEVSPLPSDVMFALGESNGAYWINMVTVFDELPCGNFSLVASHQSPEPGSVIVDVEGISLRGEVCLESVGPAGTTILLGPLAAETELRFRSEGAVDRYRLETGPGSLSVEAVTTSFTRSGHQYWGKLPALVYYNPFDEKSEYLPADSLLFYTTTAWNDGDGAALRGAAAAVFEEVLALGAEPFTGEPQEHGLFYPTPPLDIEASALHIVRYFHYDGSLAPVKELLAAHGEIEMNVFSREGSNLPTATPRNTPTPITPTATRTPRPPTPTSTPTPSPGPVSIFPSKDLYEEGEPVVFTITNHLAQPIYYRYGGCEWPVPIYIGSYIEVTLKVDPLEPEPEVASLPPGESVTCTWDGKVYQRPEWAPPDSFIRQEELAPVPRGQYQLRLNYALSPEEIAPKTRTAKGPLTTRSPVFTVFGRYLEMEISSETRVELEVDQEAYAPGNPVHFSVTNHYERSIYYTFGCAAPVVLHFSGTEPRLEQRDAVLLTLRVPDESPAATELKPGETHRCRWDQKAWQDPAKEGRARFKEYDPALGALQAPPGKYRLFLVYYFADPATFAGEGETFREQHRVITEPFTITE